MGLWETVVAGAGQIGSSVYNQYTARRNAAEAHDWSVADAAENRAWQERMSNTAHQREVDDLRKAGLNPILSGTGGAGAPTGGGATASAEAADSANMESPVSSALEISMNRAQTQLMKAQEEAASSAAELTNAQSAKVRKETQILSPKATIWEKVDEALRGGLRDPKGSVQKFHKHKANDKQIQNWSRP